MYNFDNNSIIIISKEGKRNSVKEVTGLTAHFHGHSNHIEIFEPFEFHNFTIEAQDNLTMKIGKNSRIDNLSVHKMWGSISPFPPSNINIGENFSCNGCSMFVSPDEGNITIGNDVMFSSGITMMISDAHVIINKKTNKIINRNKDIIIGNHVWVGMNATILKGTILSDGSIVGISAVVSHRFYNRDIVIAGNPARIVKKGISWSRENYGEYIANSEDEH
jgi:acetyltransferase-like isoleucine patch superfamily enzyme